MTKRQTGRPPKCGGCENCERCKKAAYMREWYGSKTLEQRRKMREGRDQERVRQADRDRYYNDPARNARLKQEASDRRKNNPEKTKAQNAVSNAIRSGRLDKPNTCSINDETCAGRIEAHHHDYSKPLEVKWICRSHHARIHAKRQPF